MRFHVLETENLNSLYGTQRVAFDEALGEAGLFLIHGPMGAGKSTLLDAICLALFGQTPRLGASGATTADGHDEGASDDNAMRVMSHGAGTCRATLELSVLDEQGERVRYRATWSAARAHRKPDGKFQAPERALEEWVDGAWRVLVRSTKKSDWAVPFGRVLRGLGFDDFQRSVMLAQFKFREFVDADRSARTKILERMTDTGRFREIGYAASTAKSDAERQEAALGAALASIALLDETARADTEAALASAVDEAARADAETTRLQKVESFVTQRITAETGLEAAVAEQAAALGEQAAAAGVLDALARDEAWAPAREAHRAHAGCGADEERARAGLAEAMAAHEAADAERAAREAALTEANGVHAAALEARAERMPAVLAAEEAWRGVALAAAAFDAAERDARTARASADAATLAFGTATTRQREATDALAAIDGRLADIPAHGRVQAERGTIELLAEGVSEHALRATRARDTRVARAAELEAHAPARARHLTELATADAALTTARAAATDTEAALAAHTGGRPTEVALLDLDAARDAAQERLAALERARTRAADLGRAVRARAEAEQHATRATETAAHARAEEATAQAHAQARGATAQALAELVEATAALLGAARYRSTLVEGEPCPVCGGEEHPWRVHPERAPTEQAHVARHEDARARHTVAAGELAQAHATAEAAGRQRAAAEAAAEAASDALRARNDELEAATRELGALWRDAGLPADTDTPTVDAAIEAARAEGAKATETAREVRARDTAHRDALAALAARESALREATAALATHDARAEQLDAAREDAAAVEAEAARARDSAQETLRTALEALEVRTDDLAAGAALVAERARTVAQLTETREQRAREAQQAAEEHTRAQVAADLAETAAAAARTLAEATQATHAERHAAASALLGGAPPEHVRAALDTAVQGAEATLATARDAASAAASAAAATLATREERARAHASAVTRLAEASDTLARHLAELHLDGVDALLAGSLDEATRVAARATRTRVESALQHAAARVAEAERALAAHLATLPEGESLDADPAVRLETVRAALVTAHANAVETHQRVGTLRGAIDADDAARTLHAGRAEAYRHAREEADAWRAIHDLIGVGNGERFATVVQALNLRRVLAYANEHLARFMPRYELQQVLHREEGPLLDFRVVDHHSQDAVRSVRSLSGGESFIVSLALALGLASTRASRLRIETLLIDEGFGSLDPQMLATATAALAALQAAVGVRIGVISHVEHLREAIPAQIVVEPQGAGRSRVRVPGQPTAG